MEELKVKVSPQVKENLAVLAATHKLGTERIAAAILESFTVGEGKVYTGGWPEGPGIRLMVDWPKFSSNVLKIAEKDRA